MNFTINDNKNGHLKPKEDYSIEMNSIYCVADGITRDSLVPDKLKLGSIEDELKYYPNPSGASLASEIFCRSFVGFLKDKKKTTEEDIGQAFIYSNSKIKELNNKYIKECDYLINDYYACVAAGCMISDNTLYWGAICDCGIAVYDNNLTLKFRTPNYMSNYNDYTVPEIADKRLNWDDAECRQIVRRNYRNKPNNPESYGALTGEAEAEMFVNVGMFDLQPKNILILYSDGFEKAIYNDEFIKYLVDNFENESKIISYAEKLGDKDYSNYGRERTLVYTKTK